MRKIAVTLFACVVLAGCSSVTQGAGTSATSAATTSASTVSSVPPTSAAAPSSTPPVNLNAQVFTVADLPTGWAVDNSSSSDTSAPACFTAVKKAFDSPQFVTADFDMGSSPELVQSIAAYASPTAASTAYGRATGVFDACKDLTFTSGGHKITGSIGVMSFPTVGSDSKAWAVSLSSSGITFGYDIVVFTQGAEIEELALGDVGSPDTDMLTSFSSSALAKLPR